MWIQETIRTNPFTDARNYKKAMRLFAKLLFSERDKLRSLYAIADPSVCLSSVVCRQSSVTLVRPTQAVELFGNFLPYDSPGSLVF